MLNVKELIENISSEIYGCCECPKALAACDKAIAEIGDGGWRAMDNAPMDGTNALLWCAVSAEIGYYCNYNLSWRTDEGIRLYPTHWMPLPDAPEDEK